MLFKSSFKISSHFNFSLASTKAYSETVTEYRIKMAQVSRIPYHSVWIVLLGGGSILWGSCFLHINLDIFFLYMT